jgi:N-acetylglucosaminylphosphatidylinositol deacetylase
MLRPALSRLVSRVSRRTWRWLLRIAVVILLLPLVLQWVVAYLVGSDARLLPSALQGAKNLLIVTAHPDDECLFFAPSILGVLGRNHDMVGGLLVMSTGTVGELLRTRSPLLTSTRQQLRDW